MVIDHELKNVIRSHHDIETDNTPYMKKATRVGSSVFSKIENKIRFGSVYPFSTWVKSLKNFIFYPPYMQTYIGISEINQC